MRRLAWIFAYLLAVPHGAAAQSGDILFWLPPDPGKTATEAQVQRNASYFSIRLHSVYAYYESGFFENIGKLVISSETTVTEDNRTVQSAMINKTWQKLDSQGDFIGVGDHLVVLSPATALNAKIKVSFRGIGEDKFKLVFDSLSDPSLKTALSLSPATATTVTAITPMIQKLLASPYTSDNPRQILDISQSFIVYAETKEPKVDALREGYLVIVSAREKKTDDLSKIVSLDPKDIRLSGAGSGLEFKEGGVWKPFKRNSYAVLSVTKTSVRGENQMSGWFRKYSAAVRQAEEKLIMGEPAARVKPEVYRQWFEGTALLYDDPHYIQSERESIKLSHFKALEDVFRRGGISTSIAEMKNLGIPPDYSQMVAAYKGHLLRQAANVTVKVQDEGGQPKPHAPVRITHLEGPASKPKEGRTNANGEFVFEDLLPGKYAVEYATEPKYRKAIFVLDPRETKEVAVEAK